MRQAENKTCQNCKKDFIIEQEDLDFYKKMDVPSPTFCPKCRFQRRMAFRDERRLFRTKSGMSNKDILTLFPPETGCVSYEEKEWWSDDWDPLGYGLDIDWNKPFLEQVKELFYKVPLMSRNVETMTNSDYCANSGYLKNCYLLFNSNETEDSLYGNAVDDSKDCVDNSHVSTCERCYHNFWLNNCHQTHFSAQCSDCQNVWFSKDCVGCSNLIGCVNLRNKKHCIFNKQYTKEEYEEKVANMQLNTYRGLSAVKDQSMNLWKRFPNKYLQGIKNQDVSGEYVTHSKNVKNSFLVRGGEDCKYVQYMQVPPNRDCYDFSIWGSNNELGYENAICGYGTSNLKFCINCWTETHDLEYCLYCLGCSYVFGCVSLKKQQYCILNKQYTKEEYEELIPKIKKHMNDMPYVDKKGRVYKYGEFFPIEFSPHGYNNTLAQEYFPLSPEEVEENNYHWIEKEKGEYVATKTSLDLVDAIEDIDDSILKEVIECSVCGSAYRILPRELEFLKREKLPLPRTCVDCRHSSRIALRNKPDIYKRKCQCQGVASSNGVYKNDGKHFHGTESCPNEFETSYSVEKPEIVYCEKCYNQEVV